MTERGRLEMVGKMRYTFASSGSPVEESVDYKKEKNTCTVLNYTKYNTQNKIAKKEKDKQ